MPCKGKVEASRNVSLVLSKAERQDLKKKKDDVTLFVCKMGQI